MATLPTRTVEVAFDSGVWTDVSAYLVDIGTRRGRNRESGAFETGTMSFTVRNDDRRFDPDHTTGPYYGKLRPNRQVRFRATYNAVTYAVFTGYVDRITQNYGGPNDATATFDCSDLFKILNRFELYASVWVTEVLTDTPTNWWRLGEPAGSTTVVDQRPANVTGTAAGGVTFGTASAVVHESDTAATFDGTDDYLTFGSAPTIIAFPYSVEMWLRVDDRSADLGNRYFFAQTVWGSGTTEGQPYGYVTGSDVGNPGIVEWDGTTSPSRIDDGAWHHLVLTATSGVAGAQTLYIDGTAVDTGTATTPGQGSQEVLVGRQREGFGAVSRKSWKGDIDEVAIYPTALSAARVAAHNSAGRTPWDDDLPGPRIARIAALVPVTTTSLGAGTTTLQSTALGGSALAYMQKVELTEAGRLFIQRDGTLKFIGRREGDLTPYTITRATLTDADAGAGRGYRDASAEVDEGTIITRATVSRAGGVAQTYSDSAAVTEFQAIDATYEGLLHDSETYSRAYAEWVVNTHKTPLTRIGAVELTLPSDPASMYPDILGLEIADRVEYRRKPQNTGATIVAPMRVEAIEHATGAHYWTTRLQLTPFNLGTSGYGVGVWDSSLWDQAVWGL